MILVVLMATYPCIPATAQNATPPRCNVGADPVNKDRQPTAGEEIIPNPADKSIVYGSGNGHDVSCTLQAGVPVVINKTTGAAVWVYGCGNPIRTLWVPKHLPVFTQTEQPQQPVMPVVPVSPAPSYSSSSVNVTIDMGREVQQQPRQEGMWQPAFVAQKKHGSGHHGLIIGVVVVAAGAAVGIAFGMKGHGNSNSGNLNTGGAH